MLSPLTLWSRRKNAAQGTKEEKNSVNLNKKESMNKTTAKAEPKAQAASHSSNVSTEMVKQLRDQTGVSVMQCKKALEEAGGNMEKALVILRKASSGMGAKKGDRTFKAGTVQSYIHANGTVGAMVELNCETDFVANNDEFKTLARDIAMHVTATNPKFVRNTDITEADKKVAMEVFEGEVKGKPEAVRKTIIEGKLNSYFAEMVLLDQPFIKNPEITIQGLIDGAMQKFGEKTDVGRFVRFKILER